MIKSGDSLDEHAYDTISGGDWINDQDAVEAFVKAVHGTASRMAMSPCVPSAA